MPRPKVKKLPYAKGANGQRMYEGDVVNTFPPLSDDDWFGRGRVDEIGYPGKDMITLFGASINGTSFERADTLYPDPRLAGAPRKNAAANKIKQTLWDKAASTRKTQRMWMSDDADTRLQAMARSATAPRDLRNEIISNSVAQFFNRPIPANVQDVDDVSARMSAMHISGYDASVQPPWPSSARLR